MTTNKKYQAVISYLRTVEQAGIKEIKDYCSQFYTWYKTPNLIMAVRDRLARVGIENVDAFSLLDRYNLPGTLWYLDPPYLPNTRSKKSNRHGYTHNLTEDQHRDLLTKAKQLNGYVMISGYKSELYKKELSDWQMVTKNTRDDSGKQREECLWMNWQGGRQLNMFT
ncbi:MAG: DNA adenine methylase [Saprospiraceae bacterium]|nr:DNA adenine methylase [Saprospiraceae bacterium]